MKRFLLSILTIWISLIIWNFSYAKDYEYKNLDIKADVNIDGTIDVKETFDTYFSVRKHWIIRIIPLNYEVEWKYFHINISNVNVEWSQYSTNRNGWDYEIKIWSANKTVIWEQFYPISYKTYWLIRNFSWLWYAELYWNLVWYDFDTNINKVKAEINLPKVVFLKSSDFLITVDWKETSVWKFAGSVDWSAWDKIVITYDKTLSAWEWITLAVKFPNNYFEFDHSRQESLIWHIWDSRSSKSGNSNFISSVLSFLFNVWIFIIACIFPFFRKGNSSIKKSEIEDKLSKKNPIVVRYNPPEWINCAEAWMLYNCILEPKDLTSLLYKWAVEWLISISLECEWDFEKKEWFIMTKLKDIDESYPQYEKDFFNSIVTCDINWKKHVHTASEFDVTWSLKSLRNYGKTKWWITVSYFSFLKTLTRIFIILALFVLITLVNKISRWSSEAIIFVIFVFVLILSIKWWDGPTQKEISLTQEWEDIASWIIWYAHFIKMCDENKLRLFLQQDPTFFDKTLPYAVAFWFESSFIRKITPVLQELDIRPTWFNWDVNETDSISKTIREITRREMLRKAREREHHSSYSSSSWFSSWSSFSSGGSSFSSGWGGWGWGSRSR